MPCQWLGTLHPSRRPDRRFSDDWRWIIMARSLEKLHLTKPKLSRQTIPLNKPKGSNMTPEDLHTITTELKRFGKELNLSQAQKEQLKTFLTERYKKLQEFRQQNPNASKDYLTRHLAMIRMRRWQRLRISSVSEP
jgi:hypothetical protein